jgi:UDP-N-acetylglucosamine 2-epimerase
MTRMKLLFSGSPEELTEGGDMDGGQPVQPDLYVLDGVTARDVLLERGVDPARIRVCGAPRFDATWVRAAKARAQTRERSGHFVVLVTPTLHDTERVLRFVAATLVGLQETRLLVKIHPKAPLRRIPEIIRDIESETPGAGSMLEIVTDRNVYACLEEADLLVATYSSVAVEALAFGLPVIVLQSGRRPNMSPISATVGTVSTARQLRDMVGSLRDDSTQGQQLHEALKDQLDNAFFGRDGGATERVAGLVTDLWMVRYGPSHQSARGGGQSEAGAGLWA